MTHTAFRALRGLQLRRCLPGFACFLGALAMAILAGCNSSSGCGGMGGGSGYQVDGMPGLMSSCTTSSTTGAGAATDPSNAMMVAQNTGFNTNANASGGAIYYSMTATGGSFPTAVGPATLMLPAGPVHVAMSPTNPNDYTLTASATGYIPYCEIVGGSIVFANTIYGGMSALTGTLRLNFPMFSGSGSFMIECVGVSGLNTTTLASLQVDVP